MTYVSPDISKHRDATIRACAADGLTNVEIGVRLGIAESTVGRRRTRLGLGCEHLRNVDVLHRLYLAGAQRMLAECRDRARRRPRSPRRVVEALSARRASLHLDALVPALSAAGLTLDQIEAATGVPPAAAVLLIRGGTGLDHRPPSSP